MVDQRFTDQARWLSLGDACRLLAVNQATLRQWADNGYLRVYRTPGGHRRFLRDDVLVFTQGTQPATNRDTREDAEGSALRRIRRRLQQEKVAQQPWYQSVEEEGRVRMRLFGRRLLSLLVREPSRRHRQEALAESHMLGHEYGSEMADRGVLLRDTIEAFIFFRTLVLDSIHPRSWSQVLELADRVLVGVAESYQRRTGNSVGKLSRPIVQEVDG
jgi:excisionase family DNA binding protein